MDAERSEFFFYRIQNCQNIFSWSGQYTSFPTERIFSIAGILVSRIHIQFTHCGQIIFLNENSV
jgi:hypothetical protein